jgi:diguanylate cyclase (GGDEF)-like protein
MVERQAVTDELTSLSNRRRFDEILDAEVERARRFDQPLGLVLLDLDDFKGINDTFGHQVGDDVLREVARVLRNSCREIDEPARYGGEELAVVLPGTDLEGAERFAERVRRGVAALRVPLDNGAAPVHVTTSLGVATLPGTSYDARSLVEAADDALYRAKRTGKNRTVLAV